MHIYNTTFGIDTRIENEFIDWLRHEFIPTAVEDGEYFTGHELFRVATQADPGVISLALHLRAEDTADIDRWYADHGSRLYAEILNRWNGSAVYFTTTLEGI